MKPNFVNMSLVLGRIEEIERKGRSFSGLDANRDVNGGSVRRERFVDLFDEEIKKVNQGKDLPFLNIDSAAPGSAQIPGTRRSLNRSEWDKYITRYSKEFGVDENLVRAVIRVESANNPNALSRKGAMGLMQLMPQTAKMLGVKDAWDPEQNIRGGVKYLSQLSDKFNGDIVKVLAGYNAGPGRVDQYNGVPPFAETQNYVRKVMALLDE